MKQLSLELHAKQFGMELSAEAHPSELQTARRMARILAGNGAEISVDDVRDSLPNLSWDLNWVGSLFREKCWVPVGFIQARHSKSHARIIRLWKLRNE